MKIKALLLRRTHIVTCFLHVLVVMGTIRLSVSYNAKHEGNVGAAQRYKNILKPIIVNRGMVWKENWNIILDK